MKYISICLILALVLCLLPGCEAQEPSDIVATTLPIYQFTSILCESTGLKVSQLVTESVSCLHDYSLNVRQVKAVEQADLIVLNGAGLEDFMEDLLSSKPQVDASAGIHLIESCHEHDHEHEHDHGHSHDVDAHIWLSPANAMVMAENICAGLSLQYPQYAAVFDANLKLLLQQLQALLDYGNEQLAQLSCRELITFHDGFAYFADCFDLTILSAMEEESGSEASAQELIELIELVEHHNLIAIFTEENGSVAAADIVAAETGVNCYCLSMAMSGQDYFAAMYHNIDTLKEALG